MIMTIIFSSYLELNLTFTESLHAGHCARCIMDTQIQNSQFFYCLLLFIFIFWYVLSGLWDLCLFFKTYVSSTSFVSNTKKDSLMNRHLSYECSHLIGKTLKIMFTKHYKCYNKGVYKVLPRELRMAVREGFK